VYYVLVYLSAITNMFYYIKFPTWHNNSGTRKTFSH